MPNYDYRCETCGHHFEVFQSMNDAKLTACPQPQCGGTVKRLLGTGAGVIFKGSGFYQTDYRSDSYKSGSKSEGEKSAPAAAPASKGAAGGD
jgi:putative FmdB family regulatory protein